MRVTNDKSTFFERRLQIARLNMSDAFHSRCDGNALKQGNGSHTYSETSGTATKESRATKSVRELATRTLPGRSLYRTETYFMNLLPALVDISVMVTAPPLPGSL